MAKDKSLSSNPVHDFHKRTKQATIKKSRAEKSKLRDTQLQQKRPETIQRQIDELKQTSRNGHVVQQDQALIASLERDLARIKKLQADGKLGPRITSEKSIQAEQRKQSQSTRVKIPKDPTKSFYYDPIYNPYGVPPPGMEYRERADVMDTGNESDSSTASSVKRIPMPRGKPPGYQEPVAAEASSNHADMSAEQDKKKHMDTQPRERQPGRMAPAQTVYSSEPVLRDLVQESAVFVPKNIQKKAGIVQAKQQIDPLDVDVVTEEVPARQRARKLNIAPSVDS